LNRSFEWWQGPPSLKLQRTITTFAKATVVNAGCGAVGSASGLGPEGRQFESGHPDFKKERECEPTFAKATAGEAEASTLVLFLILSEIFADQTVQSTSFNRFIKKIITTGFLKFFFIFT
jgi:hypothetical protein